MTEKMILEMIIIASSVALMVLIWLYVSMVQAYYHRRSKIIELHHFAKQHNLDSKALHQLYEIALDE